MSSFGVEVIIVAAHSHLTSLISERFRSLKSLEGDIVEGLDSSFHPSRVGPQLPRAMPLSSLWTCYELKKSFISFLFNWVSYFCMTYMWSCCIEDYAHIGIIV